MRRKVTFMRVEKTKQPLPENGHIFATMPRRKVRVQRVRMDRKGGGEPMNIRKFISTYKCRLCGEVFTGETVQKRIGNAYSEMFDIAMYHSNARYQRLEMNAPTILGVHRCDDGSWGLADLQGMKKGGSENGSPR